MSDLADMAADIEEHTRQMAIHALRDKQANQDKTSLSNCDECGKHIPVARQRAIKGVTTCVGCQTIIDLRAKQFTGRSY